jgi:hypothetical protein
MKIGNWRGDESKKKFVDVCNGLMGTTTMFINLFAIVTRIKSIYYYFKVVAFTDTPKP